MPAKPYEPGSACAATSVALIVASMVSRDRFRRVALAVGLFLLAPMVGEWLPGNQPITAIGSLAELAPMYGGGALLVRELARRTGRGWPTMCLLAAAYALFKDGPVDQMLWNPQHGGFAIGTVYAGAQVPVLGTSVRLLQDVLATHAVWSICVPIAMVETFTSQRRTRPWLGGVGFTVTSVLFAGGAAFLCYSQLRSQHFMASAGQLSAVAVLITALIVAAFVMGRHPSRARDGDAPSPRLAGAAAFGLAGLYWCARLLVHSWSWLAVIGWCVLVGAALTFFSRWSRSRGWSAHHRLGLAAGGLLTYTWVGFVHGQSMPGSPIVGLVGGFVFAVGSIVLLAPAIRIVHRETSHGELVPEGGW